MRQLALTLALVTTLSACVTGERLRDIRQGMSKDEVIATLGNPDESQMSGDYEALRYANRLTIGWWWWNRADYNVILRNGRVVQYGPGQIRRQDPTSNALILIVE